MMDGSQRIGHWMRKYMFTWKQACESQLWEDILTQED